jgi:hypothetical protein
MKNSFKFFPVLFLLIFFNTAKIFSADTAKSATEKIIIEKIVTEKTIIESLPFTLSGYVDTYYSMDNDNANSPDRFPGVSPNRDEYRLNIAQISARYFKDNVRGNLTIQYGDIPDVLYPEKQRLLPEANVGFSPWEKDGKSIWIDAGYFVTHIGTEAIRPIENTFSSYAMVSFYEPLPQAGVSVSYSSRRFNGAFWITNGYSVLGDNNKNKSIGLSLTYWPYKNVSFSYNNLGGNESSDLDNQRLRLYNNFIIKGYFWDNWSLIINSDFCFQQNSKLDDTASVGTMLGGFLTVKYSFDSKFSLAYRGEYFMDFDGILSPIYDVPNTFNRTGLMIYGLSLAFEYKPMPNAYVRLEGRYLQTLRDLHIFSDNKNYRIDGSLTMGVGF